MGKQYRKLTTDIGLVLCHNTDYYDCFLMKKILSDIENYKTMNFENNKPS